MAAKSTTQLTNMNLTPPSRIPPRTWMGRLMAMIATLEKDAANDTGLALRFFRVHSSWVPESIIIQNDVITSVSDVNLGLYTIRGGAVVNENVLGDALDLTSADRGEVLYATAALKAAAGQTLWERLSLTEDPDLWYDLAITVISTAANGGTISMRAKFLTGS